MQMPRLRLTFAKSRVQSRIGRLPVHGITCDQPDNKPSCREIACTKPDNKAYPHGSCVCRWIDQGVPVPPSLPPPPTLGLRLGLVAGK